MEPRGGIEPPHVHGVVHGRRFRFCCCTRHIKHHHKMMLCPAYTGHLWSHREESNLQPTDYKTVALPVELRWHNRVARIFLPPPGQGGKEAYGKRPGPAPPPVPSLTISDFRVGFQGSKQIAHAHVVA